MGVGRLTPLHTCANAFQKKITALRRMPKKTDRNCPIIPAPLDVAAREKREISLGQSSAACSLLVGPSLGAHTEPSSLGVSLVDALEFEEDEE